MATVSTYVERGNKRTERATLLSDQVPVADTFEATDLYGNSHLTHCFLGVVFYESDGTTVATPTAGTLTVSVRTENNPGAWDSPETSSIDATDPQTVDFAANTTGIRVVPSGVTGGSADHYRVVMTRNQQ